MTTALVCGSGPAFFTQLARAQRAVPGADAIGVNVTGLFLRDAAHLVSLHPDVLGPLRALRATCDWARPGDAPATHSRAAHPGVDRVWLLPPDGPAGTSALFAVWVALGLGYDAVVLVGVPMDAGGRFFDPPGAVTWPHQDDRPAWERAAGTWFEGRVRSLTGWTRALLGAPTAILEEEARMPDAALVSA